MTAKYIQSDGKQFEDNDEVGMPKRAEHDLTLWKDDIPQHEFKELYKPKKQEDK
jgi:hypothetical protein